MSETEAAADAIARDILAYLRRSPHAADSTDGVSHWWLCDRYDVLSVKRALEALLQRQAISASKTTGGRVIYHANRVPGDPAGPGE